MTETRNSIIYEEELSNDQSREELVDNMEVGKETYRIDHFMCPPCTCQRKLVPGDKFTTANCSFAKLTEVPLSLPSDVQVINMSFNFLHTFSLCSLSNYTELEVLDLRNNKIQNVEKCQDIMSLSKLQRLIFDGNLITEIEDNSFRPLPKLHELRISNNKLKFITEAIFKDLHELRYLDISNNQISNIDDGAFDSLGKLVFLYLNNNPRLGYGNKFKPRIVQNLSNLRELQIQGNSGGNQYYPNKLLSKLVNLTVLTIDGLGSNATIGTPQQKLKRLRELSFGPHAVCNFKNVSSHLFRNVPFLTSLTFVSCKFQRIDPEAFRYIPNIKKYSLMSTKSYDLDQAFKDLIGLQNSSLSSLTFNRLSHSYSICRSLSFEHGKFIKDLRLKYLDLSDNRLALLQYDFVQCIPVTLVYLILRENRFTIIGINIPRLSFLTNLIELDLTNQINTGRDRFPQGTSTQCRPLRAREAIDTNCLETRLHEKQDTSYWRNTDKESELQYYNSRKNSDTGLSYETQQKNNTIGDIYLNHSRVKKRNSSFPPKLISIKASLYPFFAPAILFTKIARDNGLLYLDLSSNFVHNWGDGQLPATAVKVNLDDNQGETLQAQFFQKAKRLLWLSLRHNYLGSVFAADTNGTIFASSERLEFLDISDNMIFALPRRFFKGLVKLTTLIMCGNKLQTLNLDFSHMDMLNFIDISKNSISWISNTVRQDLDDMATRRKIMIDFTDNIFSCSCSGIKVLHWMENTRVFLISHQYLECIHIDGDISFIKNIHEEMVTLERQCASYPPIIIASITAFVGIFLAFIGGAIVYRKRWLLLYSLNNGLLVKMFGFKPAVKDKTKFLFDAYVIYDQEDKGFILTEFLDEIEAKRGHRLCIEDRDFLPGTFIFNNTNSGVQNSAMTVFVVSKDLIESMEYEYPLQIALLEEYHSKHKRDVSLLVLYGECPRNDLPKEMQMLMMKERFLAYPPCEEDITPEIIQGFWDRLSNTIGHSESESDPTELSPLLS